MSFSSNMYSSVITGLNDINANLAKFNVGENGMVQHSLHDMTTDPSTPKVQGSLVGLSVVLMRGLSRGDLKTHTIGIIENANQIVDKKVRAGYLIDIIKLAFQTRDIRGKVGKGERTVAYWLFIELFKTFPRTMEILINEIPNYGSWLDINKILAILYDDIHEEKDEHTIIQLDYFATLLIKMYVSQLNDDYTTYQQNENSSEPIEISLAAKWVPKEGRSLDKKYKLTKKLAQEMFPEEFQRDFRKAMSMFRNVYTKLNKAINTTEVFMCAKNFADIKFHLVPGRCLSKFSKAWLDENKRHKRRHEGDSDRDKCRENYMAFLSKVAEGKLDAKGRSLFIHEIVSKVIGSRNLSKEYEILLEGQFRSHVEQFRECLEKSKLDDTVFMADVSGSMSGDPLYTAIGLSILGSTISTPAWRDHVLTFESTPSWVKLRYPTSESEFLENGYWGTYIKNYDEQRAGGELTYIEKIRLLSHAPWGGSTNFLKAVDLVAQAALQKGVQMPKRIMVITDMQWDAADASSSIFTDDTLIGRALSKANKIILGFNNKSLKWETGFETIRNALLNTMVNVNGEEKPLGMPEFIVWNVRGDVRGAAAAADTPGIQMISGFSSAMLNLFLTEGELVSPAVDEESGSNINSWDTTLRKMIDDENYNKIGELIMSIGEKPWFSCFNQ